MKIKKEYIILFIIITVLVLYISLRKGNRIQYDIPELSRMDQEKISSIEIKTKDKNISILKEGEKWVIGEEKYVALNPAIEDMLDFLEKPVLMAVVSDSKNYERYGLDETGKLSVIAATVDGAQRSINIGFRAAGQRHTFIKLENDHRVYNAGDDLRDIFTLDIDDLRDKKVIPFDTVEINSINLITGEKTFTAVRKEIQSEKKDPEKAEPETKYIWQNPEGKGLDEAVITGILKEISTLRCLAYYYDKKIEDFKDPVHIIKLKGKKEYILTVFSKGEDDSDYPVTSTESPSPFKISQWKVDDIIDEFGKLDVEEEGENTNND